MYRHRHFYVISILAVSEKKSSGSNSAEKSLIKVTEKKMARLV